MTVLEFLKSRRNTDLLPGCFGEDVILAHDMMIRAEAGEDAAWLADYPEAKDLSRHWYYDQEGKSIDIFVR